MANFCTAVLILPALAVIGRRNPLGLAWASGLLSVLLGVALSVPFDLPTGPTLVMAYIVVTVAIRLVLGKRKTLLA